MEKTTESAAPKEVRWLFSAIPPHTCLYVGRQVYYKNDVFEIWAVDDAAQPIQVILLRVSGERPCFVSANVSDLAVTG